MDEQLREYRSFLIDAEQKAQERYDKTIITLSGGAIGISFSFVNNFIQGAAVHSWLLLGAWIAWGASITAVLASFYFSTLALRRTVNQIDDESTDIRSLETPGGQYTTVTKFLNAAGGSLFFVGVILLVAFVSQNI